MTLGLFLGGIARFTFSRGKAHLPKLVAHVKKSRPSFATLAMDSASVCNSNQLHETDLLLLVQFPAPLLAIAGNGGREGVVGFFSKL